MRSKSSGLIAPARGKGSGNNRFCTYVTAIGCICFFIIQLSIYEWETYRINEAVPDYAVVPVRRFTNTTPFVFVHVPKAAGTTITENFKTVFRQTCTEVRFQLSATVNKSIYEADKFTEIVQKYTGEGINLGEAIQRAKRWHNMSCFFTHAQAGPRFDARQELLNAVVNHGARFRYVLGHVPYGYCVFAEEGCVYITVLREPISRLYSHYMYLNRTHPEFTREMCKGRCNDFAGFVNLAADNMVGAGMDNMQTRMISGDSFWATVSRYRTCINGLDSCDVVTPAAITRDTLEQAKYNLVHRFAVVGVMDHLTIFKRMMEEIFGIYDPPDKGDWATTSFKNSKESSSTTHFDPSSLDPQTLQRLYEFQKYDIELYQFAMRRAVAEYADVVSGKLPILEESAPAPRYMVEMDDVDRKVVGLMANYSAPSPMPPSGTKYPPPPRSYATTPITTSPLSMAKTINAKRGTKRA